VSAPEVSPRITEEMRDVLGDLGFVYAEHAPAEFVRDKIVSIFGSVENYKRQYGWE
jgi:hypothetical protein